jgi:hypothetical protein
MDHNTHAGKIRTYVRYARGAGKPTFSIDQVGNYVIYGAITEDGSRPVISENYFSDFGSAVSHALKDASFYDPKGNFVSQESGLITLLNQD